MRFRVVQPNNPILRAEISYQQRTMPRWLQWFDRFGVILVALVISLAILLAPIRDDLYGSGSWIYPNSLDVILPVLWITQAIVIVRCIFAGTNGMHHHRGWQQSDMVVLTCVTPRQILVGKFWGTLYQLRGWIVGFGLVKLALFAFLITNLIVSCYRYPFDTVRSDMGIYLNGIEPIGDVVLHQTDFSFAQLPSLDRLVITGLLSVSLSILEIMASIAIGIFGGLIPEKIFGLGIAFVIRLIPVVIFTLFPDYPSATGSLTWRWYEYTWFSLADGGSTALLRSGIAFRGTFIFDGITAAILLAFEAAISIYIGYLLFAFVVSYILLRRQGFLCGSRHTVSDEGIVRL